VIERSRVVPVGIGCPFNELNDVEARAVLVLRLGPNRLTIVRNRDHNTPGFMGAEVFDTHRSGLAWDALEPKRGKRHQGPTEPSDPGKDMLAHSDTYP
jgi:hypothetical protein